MSLHTLLINVALAIHPCLASAETFDMTEVKGEDVTVRDLQYLGYAVGVKMNSFDYEISDHHCVHFWVSLQVDSNEPEVMDARGLCTDAGPHRLTVQWREKEGALNLYFYLYRRDESQSSSGVGGPQIDISGHGVWSGRRVSPALDYGVRTTLADVSYGRTVKNEDTGHRVREWTKRIMVQVELRANPEKILGTE
jgi:hypothetical protein